MPTFTVNEVSPKSVGKHMAAQSAEIAEVMMKSTKEFQKSSLRLETPVKKSGYERSQHSKQVEGLHVCCCAFIFFSLQFALYTILMLIC